MTQFVSLFKASKPLFGNAKRTDSDRNKSSLILLTSLCKEIVRSSSRTIFLFSLYCFYLIQHRTLLFIVFAFARTISGYSSGYAAGSTQRIQSNGKMKRDKNGTRRNKYYCSDIKKQLAYGRAAVPL